MQKTVMAAMGFVAACLVSGVAQAGVYSFNFDGPGVRGSVDVTYGTTSDAKYPTAFEVTGISGKISDSNNGLNLVDAAITGLLPLNISAPDATNLLAPSDFSKFYISGFSNFGNFSYDNLIWPAGSLPSATDYQVHGGFLDIYGLLFSIAGGYTVNFWSNGDSGTGPDYGIGIATALQQYDYVSGGVQVPEPGTFALFGAGLLGLLAGRRKAA